MSLTKPGVYRFCTVVILGGFLMLVQPLSQTLFSLGLPVMLFGIVIHAIVDHVPDRKTRPKIPVATGGRQT